MITKWIKNIEFNNRTISIILLIIFSLLLIYTYNTEWSTKVARDDISAGFFPKAILILVIILCLGMALNKQSKEVPGKLDEFQFKNLIFVILSLFVSWIYFLILLEIGFIISSSLFLFVTTYFLGPRSFKISIITTIIMIVFVYSFFTIIQVPTNIF